MTTPNTFHDWFDILGDRIADGWKPSLLTLMFHPQRGSDEAVRVRQARLIEETYGRFVTRAERCPTRASRQARLPIWICSPDFPVPKHDRKSLAEVAINNGQHVHGIALLPPACRLREPLAEHFATNQERYVSPGRVSRVHALTITHDPKSVFGYVAKSVDRGRVGPETLVVLPRALSEIRPDDRRIGRNFSLFA